MAHYNTYFDEIKPDANAGRDWYMIGGLVVPVQHIRDIENKLNAISLEVFGTEAPDEQNEFHCKDIWQAKKAFSGVSIERRIEVFSLLSQALNEFVEEYEVGKVYSRVRRDMRIKTSRDVSEVSFQYFCERVQKFLGDNNTSNLFGDFESKVSSGAFTKQFNEYRKVGKTPWAHGIALKGLVDNVSFHHSHNSRLIQLADTYLFFTTFTQTGRSENYMFGKVREIVRKTNLGPNRYKEYPFH